MREDNCLRNNGQKLTSAAEDDLSDNFFELLSPQLDEAASFPDGEVAANDILWLLEENARLRALAVTLSNLVGDLSNREWRNALASSDRATLDRVGALRR
jgi:hypothetical protein